MLKDFLEGFKLKKVLDLENWYVVTIKILDLALLS